MKRLITLMAPSAGVSLLRVSQLLVLATLARLSPDATRHAAITGMGLLSAMAMISDSGGAYYLLNTPRERLSRNLATRVAKLHLVTTAAGIAVAVGATLAKAGSAPIALIWILASLALTLVLDSLTRTLKAPLLVVGEDGTYGAVDVAVGVAKSLVLIVGLVFGSAMSLALLPLVSLVGSLYAWKLVAPRLAADQLLRPGINGEVLAIGFAGALGAGYSQAPLFAATALLPIGNAAAFSSATRVLQALEFVPATFSLQIMPRLKRSTVNRRLVHGGFVALGALMAGCAAAAEPLIHAFLRGVFPGGAAWAFLLVAFAIKAGNYFLVTVLIADRGPRARLTVSTVTLGISILVAIPLVLGLREAGASLSSAIIELSFAAICLATARGRTGGRVTASPPSEAADITVECEPSR